MSVRKALLQTIAKIVNFLSVEHLHLLAAASNNGSEGAGGSAPIDVHGDSACCHGRA
jgi:hypothetical protein